MHQLQMHERATEDLIFWAYNDSKMLAKIFRLIESILKTPFRGIGRPEALKYDLVGYWSRRINQEHRIVYRITDDYIIIIQCRGHYDDK
ncbi:MAG: Txe/YoeB family addiction module toxin [Chitinophagales bacterium]